MRPDKPQFWTGGDVNLAMTEIIRPYRWEPIKNLTAKTLVDVHIDSREMLQGALKVIQDEIVTDVITTPVQKNTFVAPSQSLTFETLEIGSYNISTATFTREVFTISGGTNLYLVSMMFNNDGTRLFILNDANNRIYEYSLSTPYDISTTTWLRTALIIPSQTESTPKDMMFNNDGTRLFVLGDTNNSIFRYILSTPYDISTAGSGTSVLSVSAQDTSPRNMMFNNDGTRLFVLGDANNRIYEYSLSTPYDISTATFTRNALSVAAQDTSPRNMMFNNDGTRLFVLGDVSNNIFEYNLSTPYDISTAGSGTSVLSVDAQDTSPKDMMFNNDGTRLFVLGSANSKIYEYIIDGIWTGNVKIRTLTN